MTKEYLDRTKLAVVLTKIEPSSTLYERGVRWAQRFETLGKPAICASYLVPSCFLIKKSSDPFFQGLGHKTMNKRNAYLSNSTLFCTMKKVKYFPLYTYTK